MLAQRAGISINAFIKQALEKQITAMLQNRNLLQIHTEQCRIWVFGIFRPTIKAKSADTAESVTASNIVRKRIVFTPGKIFQRTLGEMSVTRAIPIDTDYTDGSSSGGNGSGGNQGGDGGIEDDPLG